MPHPQGHSHAIDLVRQIQAMNRGEFVDGEVENCHHSKFSIGVAGYPEKHCDACDAQSDLLHLKAKVDAGADYVMTQICYDATRILRFIDRCREVGIQVPIIPGIKPLSTLRQLTLLPQTFAIELPEPLRREVEAHATQADYIRQIGIEWAIDQCRTLKAAGIPVLHFYTMGRAENVRQIVKALF
jgi:methylenetetrahydrofolate reductase (NADPH)